MNKERPIQRKRFRPAVLVLLAVLVPGMAAGECRTDFATETAARTGALLEPVVSAAALARLDPDRHAARLAESARSRMDEIEKAVNLRVARALEDKRVHVLARSRPAHFATRPGPAREEVEIAGVGEVRYEPVREPTTVLPDRHPEPAREATAAGEPEVVAMAGSAGCQ